MIGLEELIAVRVRKMKLEYKIETEETDRGISVYNLIINPTERQREIIIQRLEETDNSCYLKCPDHKDDHLNRLKNDSFPELDIDSGIAIKDSLENIDREWANLYCEEFESDIEMLLGPVE